MADLALSAACPRKGPETIWNVFSCSGGLRTWLFGARRAFPCFTKARRANRKESLTPASFKSSWGNIPSCLAFNVLWANRKFCRSTSALMLLDCAWNDFSGAASLRCCFTTLRTASCLTRLIAAQLRWLALGPRLRPLSLLTKIRWRAPWYTRAQTPAALFARSAIGVVPKIKHNSLRLLETVRRERLWGKSLSDWLNKCSVPQLEKVNACHNATKRRKASKCWWPAGATDNRLIRASMWHVPHFLAQHDENNLFGSRIGWKKMMWPLNHQHCRNSGKLENVQLARYCIAFKHGWLPSQTLLKNHRHGACATGFCKGAGRLVASRWKWQSGKLTPAGREEEPSKGFIATTLYDIRRKNLFGSETCLLQSSSHRGRWGTGFFLLKFRCQGRLVEWRMLATCNYQTDSL